RRRHPAPADHAGGDGEVARSPGRSAGCAFVRGAAGGPAGAGRGAAAARAGLSPVRRTQGCGAVRLIDSHCHLDFPDFADELDAVVERARVAGVERMITIGTRVDKAARAAEIAERYASVYFTVGTHPHEAASA